MRHPFRKLIFSCLMAVSAYGGAAQAAAVVQNGGFEAPIAGGGCSFSGCDALKAGQDLGGWTVIGPKEILLLGSNYAENHGNLHFTADEGNYSLDLTGFGNRGGGGIEQTIATNVGSTYRLSFFVGNQDNKNHDYRRDSAIRLAIDDANAGLFQNTESTRHDVAWEQFTHDFVATNALTKIAFLNATNHKDDYAGLDNVSIAEIGSVDAGGGIGGPILTPGGPVPAPVPVPPSVALFGSALAALCIVKRRKTTD